MFNQRNDVPQMHCGIHDSTEIYIQVTLSRLYKNKFLEQFFGISPNTIPLKYDRYIALLAQESCRLGRDDKLLPKVCFMKVLFQMSMIKSATFMSWGFVVNSELMAKT